MREATSWTSIWTTCSYSTKEKRETFALFQHGGSEDVDGIMDMPQAGGMAT